MARPTRELAREPVSLLAPSSLARLEQEQVERGVNSPAWQESSRLVEQPMAALELLAGA
jgi:hypothetical protein